MKHLSENLVQYYNDQVQVATTDSLYGPEMPLFKAITPAKENINGVEVNRFPFNRWHYPLLNYAGRGYKKMFKKTLPHRLYKYRWELDCKGIDDAMKNTDADVIMATTGNYMFCDYPVWRSRTKNPKPFVLYGALHLHISWPADAPVINRARACDCYIANTDFERNKLIGYGVQPNKIVTTGTGITANDYICDEKELKAFRDRYGIAGEDILVGHIGRLSQGKGAGILLDAFSEIHNRYKNVKLLLAGTSTDFVAELKQKSRQYALPVIFLEDFDNALKPLLFNAIDIFVLASKGESFGVVFLEAWACRKPVIGVGGGAVASLIKEGSDGLLFEPDNKQQLGAAIEALIGDGNKRKALGENGYTKIQQQYSWPVVTRKYRDAYLLGIENFKRTSTV